MAGSGAVPVPSELGWETSGGGTWEAAWLGGGRKTGPWAQCPQSAPPWLAGPPWGAEGWWRSCRGLTPVPGRNLKVCLTPEAGPADRKGLWAPGLQEQPGSRLQGLGQRPSACQPQSVSAPSTTTLLEASSVRNAPLWATLGRRCRQREVFHVRGGVA